MLLLLRVSFVVLPPLFSRREYMSRPLRSRSSFVSFTLAPPLMPFPPVPGRLLHHPFPLPPFMPFYSSAPRKALRLVFLDGRMLCSYPWLRIRSRFLLSPRFLKTLLVVALTLIRVLGFFHAGLFLRARRMMESGPSRFRRFFFGLPPLSRFSSCRLALNRAS